MQSVSSRIWTRVAVSNSYDDNDYTTGTSLAVMIRGLKPFLRALVIAWRVLELSYNEATI